MVTIKKDEESIIFLRMIGDNTTVHSGRYILQLTDLGTNQKIFYYDFDRSLYPKRYNLFRVTTAVDKGRYKLDMFETYADVEPVDMAAEIAGKEPVYSTMIFVEDDDNYNYISRDESDFDNQ